MANTCFLYFKKKIHVKSTGQPDPTCNSIDPQPDWPDSNPTRPFCHVYLYRQAQVPTSQFRVVLTWCLSIPVLTTNLQFFKVSYSRLCPRTSKTGGTSKKWVLELKDERQVVVPIKIKSQLIDSALVSDVDVEQKEIINPGNRLQIIYKVILNVIQCLWRMLIPIIL